MRIIFCADVKYPHGVAGANRVQYVAKCLQQMGHEVLVFATGSTIGNIDSGTLEIADGIMFSSIPIRTSRIGMILDTKIFSGRNVANLLKKYKVTKDDLIYVYASSSLYIEPLLGFISKYKMKAVIDVVEWFQPYQYKYGSFNYRYLSVKIAQERLKKEFGNVIVISELLQKKFIGEGCNTFLLPMVIDTQIKSYEAAVDKDADVKEMIYQGNPCREDFVTMLKAMIALKEKGKSNFLFHVTGVTETSVRKQLKSEAYLLDRLKKNIIFHGWLDYSELEDLFSRIDFLFMSRKDDLVRRANFPSKLPECMARGIVPICNKVGDYWKYLSDKDSILFDVSNVSNCVDALNRAMDISRFDLCYMKENAVLCAQKNFDYRVWAEKLNDFICNI